MYVWEAKLIVRLRACEGRLADNQERERLVIDRRARHGERSVAWHEYDKLLRIIREKIDRDKEEIEFVQMLQEVGPIVGGEISLAREFGSGPTIIDLIQREADLHEHYTEEFRAGIEHALNVIRQPYRFLNEEEREGYRKAEQVARKATEEEAQRVRPNRRVPNVQNVKPPVAKAVLVRINPETGKAEAGF